MKITLKYLKPYFATLLGLILATGLVGFITPFPNEIMFMIFLFVFFICIYHGVTLKHSYLFFILYLIINIIITNPDALFHSWERLAFFSSMLLAVSPIVMNVYARTFRWQAFKVLISIAVVLSTLSFFAFFLGINMFVRNGTLLEDYVSNAGWFSGLYRHSMILGPMSALGACSLVYLGLAYNKKYFFLLAVPCVGSVMFAASRTAFVALVISLLFMLFQFSKNKEKFLKYLMISILVIGITFPLWNRGLGRMASKQAAFEGQGRFGSRTELWENRISEFKSSPVCGVGFSAVSLASHDYNPKTGGLEPGSSWLAILSMTGILGFAFVLYFFYQAYTSIRKSKMPRAVLLMAALIFIAVHMIAEGYIYAASNPECVIAWLIIACCTDLNNQNKHETCFLQ